MRPIYLKSTKQYIENSKDWGNGTGKGCAGTNNPGVNHKLDNPLKGVRNPIPRKPDNPLKGIQNLVPNGTCNQWTIGLNVPT